jgi:hypothetical protein
MKPLILIGALISIVVAQAFAETFEYIPVWNWDGSSVKRTLTIKEYNSFPAVSDKVSLKQALGLAGASTKITFSPDGTKACFQSYNQDINLSKIFISSLSPDENPKNLIKSRHNEFDPVFLSSNEVVYCSDRTGTPKLWKISVGKNAKPEQLTFKNSIDFDPDVSINTGQIVFNAIFPETGSAAICITDAAGGDFKYLCDGLMPRFSLDGKRLAFIVEDSGNTQVWVTPVAAVKPALLVSVKGNINSLCWGPKGKIYITSDSAEDNFNIFMVDVKTKNITQLTDNPSAEAELVYSSSGDCLYFTSNRGGKWDVWQLNMLDIFGVLAPEEVYYLAKDGKVLLSWQPADNDNADGYNVYFKPASGKHWWQANDDVVNSLSFAIDGLKNGSLYDFTVTALDQEKAIESPYSKVVSTAPFVVVAPVPVVVEKAATVKKAAKKNRPRKAPKKAFVKPAVVAPAVVAPAQAPVRPAAVAPAAPATPQAAPANSAAPSGGDDWGDSKSSTW